MILSGPLGLRHAALECTDLKRSTVFYQTLGFSPYYEGDADWAMLFLGDTYLSLVPVDKMSTRETGKGSHPTHLGLVYSNRRDIDALHGKLSDQGARLSKVEVHRDGSYGFYVADPDGNSLECISIPHRSHSEKTVDEAWVLIAHGSRDPRWATPFHNLVDTLQIHVPSTPCFLSFMEFAQPTLPDVIDEAIALGMRRIRIFPLFLASGGGHMSKDIPALIDLAKGRFPGVEFICSEAIGETTLVQQAMIAAVVRAAKT